MARSTQLPETSCPDTEDGGGRGQRASGSTSVTAITLDRLTHRYGRSRGAGGEAGGGERTALDQVSFEVAVGEVFGVLGPNGSGKSTLFAILATLLRPTDGRASVFGFDTATEPHQVRHRIGVVFQTPSLDLKLTARENMIHQGHLYGLCGRALRQRADELLERFDLAKRSDELVERFSGGMRRRLELAKAVLHRPALLLLDEPAAGLDPASRRELWIMLDQLRAQTNMTVALTTHLMDQANRCDRVAILNAGHLIGLDRPAALVQRIGGDVVTIEPADPDTAQELRKLVEQRFGPWAPGAAPQVTGNRIHLQKRGGGALVAQLTSALPERIGRVTVGPPTLEDVFLQLTGLSLPDQPSQDSLAG